MWRNLNSSNLGKPLKPIGFVSKLKPLEYQKKVIMINISKSIIEMVNKPGRIGILCTVDPDGNPNAAYLGSSRFRDDKTLSIGLMGGRTLENLKTKSSAMFFCIEESPVKFSTSACRLYLKVREFLTEGVLLNQIKDEITKRVDANAAKMISTAVTFDITEIRNLVDK